MSIQAWPTTEIDQMITTLHQRWLNDWQRAGGGPTAGQSAWQYLQAAYEAPHRHYHTLTHLSECFAWFDQLSDDLSNEERLLLSFAIWFHDIVYDPTRSDNEANSAVIALDMLPDDTLSSAHRQQLHQMIIATASHQSDDLLTQRLLDIDLSILAAHSERFAIFEQQIRSEYQHVPTALFAVGRSQVLQRFLASEPLYHHPVLAKLTQQAKHNLRTSTQHWAEVAADSK